MAVDQRLKQYWTNVSLWHWTHDPSWIRFLDVMWMTDDGVAGRAAKRFTAAHNKEVLVDSS